MSQERLHLLRPARPRMAFAIEQHKAPYLIDIDLLGTDTIVLDSRVSERALVLIRPQGQARAALIDPPTLAT